jgi:hypothetical protein
MGLRLDVEVRDSELLSRLNEGTTVVIPRELTHMVEEIVEESIAVAQEYPPETEANQPPPPYYQRGAGMIGYGGGLVPGKYSENLGAQWVYEITPTEHGADGTITNRASYSGYVHGDLQDEHPQVPWHAEIGWPIMADVVRAQVGEAQGGPAARVAGAAKDAVESAAQRIVNFFNR